MRCGGRVQDRESWWHAGRRIKSEVRTLLFDITTSALDKAMCQRLTFLDVTLEQRADCCLVRVGHKDLYRVMRALEDLGAQVLRDRDRT